MQSGTLVHEHYDTEIDDLMVFCHEQSSITRQIIVSILYTELAWFRGYPYTFPVIPPQLEKKVPQGILEPPHRETQRKQPKVVALPVSTSTVLEGRRQSILIWWTALP